MTESLDSTSDVSLRAMRVLSKTVFGGAQYRIEIGGAIADLEDFRYFNASALAEHLGVSRQSVGHELRMLEDAGLIKRVPHADDGARKVFYNPEPSTYWAWCRQARESAVEMLGRKKPY